jgi:atypical dual specificity phosphatase
MSICLSCLKQVARCFVNDIPICNDCYAESVQLLVIYDTNRKPEDSRVIQIDKHLYISDQDAARNLDHLKKEGIKKILIAGSYLQPWFLNDFDYKQLAWEDSLKQKILPDLDEALRFLQNTKQKTLVHCAQGISRSGSLIVAYLMKKHSISYDEALQMARSKSPRICPNPSFETQLRSWERTIRS